MNIQGLFRSSGNMQNVSRLLQRSIGVEADGRLEFPSFWSKSRLNEKLNFRQPAMAFMYLTPYAEADEDTPLIIFFDLNSLN